MGQKVNSNVIRLGYIKTWNNIWFSNKNEYAENLLLDIKIRNILFTKFNKDIISHIQIEHLFENIKILIFTSKPGVLIGKGGNDIDNIKKKIFSLVKININISIYESPNLDINAQLISNNIAIQLEKRIALKKILKRCIQNLEKFSVKGIKIRVKGRIGGAEIARTECIKIGRIPLHTFRADIDYGYSTALTNFGIIGVKVWIFHNEIFNIKG